MLLAYNNAACSLCCLLTTMQHAPYAALLVQCCRLPTVAKPHCEWLPTATLLPILQAANRGNTALQVAPYNAARGSLYAAAANMWRYRTRLPMLLAYNNAACSLCCTSSSMLQADNIWRYRTANDSQRQRCCLASGSLYAAPMLQSLALCCGCQVLLAVKLPAVNCPPNNCQPTEPARRRLARRISPAC
jgi:hypothetical protein